MQWNQSQLETIDKVKAVKNIPQNERRYKCESCKTAFSASQVITETITCPSCGAPDTKQMCPLDHVNCGKDPTKACASRKVFDHAEMCPLCGEPVCPGCGSHDVEVMSRITGYLQDYSGWNAGKAQEFKDRVRYTL